MMMAQLRLKVAPRHMVGDSCTHGWCLKQKSLRATCFDRVRLGLRAHYLSTN